MAHQKSFNAPRKAKASPAAHPEIRATAVFGKAKAKFAGTKTSVAAVGKRSAAKTKAAVASTRQAGPVSYAAFYQASPIDRIAMIKSGIHATMAKQIIADLALGQGTALKALNLSTATVNKKSKQADTLTPAESERVIGIARLVGQVEAMVRESGDPTGFDAKAWISRWLREPLPSLGGARPLDLMDTIEGQTMVSTALAQIRDGAYA